jgi:hypothetical protein
MNRTRPFVGRALHNNGGGAPDNFKIPAKNACFRAQQMDFPGAPSAPRAH